MKTIYNGFIYYNTYNLDEYIPLMNEQLIGRFNYKTGYDDYFYDKSFTLLLGTNNEEIYEKDGYSFLDCEIVFPTSMAYCCTICWKKEEDDSLQFYWTTNFPDEELQDHINGRGLPDDFDL